MIETKEEFRTEQKRLAESIARKANERVTVTHYNIATSRLWASLSPALQGRLVLR